MTLETELSRQQRENLMIVSNLANSLLLIIDDILDISKSSFSLFRSRRRLTAIAVAVEAGRMTMEMIPFSVRSAVFGVLKTLAVKATQSKLDLMYAVEGDIPDLLVGDPFRLKQIITNLIGQFFVSFDSHSSADPNAQETPSSLRNEVRSLCRVDCKLPISRRRRTSSNSAFPIPESESSLTSSISSSTRLRKLTDRQRGCVESFRPLFALADSRFRSEIRWNWFGIDE